MFQFEKTFGVKPTDLELEGCQFLNRTGETFNFIGVARQYPTLPLLVVMQCTRTGEVFTRSEDINWGAYALLRPTAPGKLIYIEGVDSVGKATQTKLLASKLRAAGKTVVTLTYPDYEKPVGQIIKRYLNGEFGEASTISPELISCAYALDRAKDMQDIKEALLKGAWVILDRSPYSNSAFQGGKLPHKEGMELARHLADLEFDAVGFPKPDKVFFLDAQPSVAAALMATRKASASIASDGKKDQHESNSQLMDSAYHIYRGLCKEGGEWEGVPVISKDESLRTQDEVSTAIYNALTEWLE